MHPDRLRKNWLLDDNYIPLFGGRPNRSTVIGSDDIANLIIALNTAKSIDDFVAVV